MCVGCWGQADCMGGGDLTKAEWNRLESLWTPNGGAPQQWKMAKVG